MKGIFLLTIVLSALCARAQNINIKIFENQKVANFTFTAVSGKYELVNNNRIEARIATGDSVIFTTKGKKIRAEDGKGNRLGSFKQVHIRGTSGENYFAIRTGNDGAARSYDDDLQLTQDSCIFSIINDVSFEKYIAAVVECEGGPSAHSEYYKTQAILCRTYAIKYFDKHIAEGYSLCDGVHCQVYKNRCSRNRNIAAAALETAGLIVVDSKMDVISATFYSNSGGQTANSEDVWPGAQPYLRATADPYSKGQHCSTWTKTVSINEWRNYLLSKGIQVPEGSTDFGFSQPSRKPAYVYRSANIPTKTIRADWGLRSSFFDLTVKGDSLVFDGRGYGHGVGLSQEGAMNMAKQGFKYDQIINQYYQGVNIVSVRALNFFQVEQ